MINAVIKREERRANPNVTQLNFLKNSVRVFIYSVATILIINTILTLKSLGTALFAEAGILAAIIGFASQQAFANLIGGIFIMLFKERSNNNFTIWTASFTLIFPLENSYPESFRDARFQENPDSYRESTK